MSARHDTPVLLYVEDEETDVFLLRGAFRNTSYSWRVETVCNGHMAIEYLSGAGPYGDRARYPKPNMVLLDLGLPLMSGFEVLQSIRREPEYVNLPIVVFSSSARIEDRTQATQLGANGFITKPNGTDDLRRTVVELQTFYERCDRIATVEARRGSIIRI